MPFYVGCVDYSTVGRIYTVVTSDTLFGKKKSCNGLGLLLSFDAFAKESRKKEKFWTKRAIFLGKYIKKPVKDCEFADRKHNTLISIFSYVILNKIYLIFQRLIKKKH